MQSNRLICILGINAFFALGKKAAREMHGPDSGSPFLIV
ncbi:hypothetical protein EVA_00296 [gut metagenome]|uniref:Uncharacterized protein n=1 Tax=gut metagenome TaxID=749906 RepID=J9GRF9_9ZZZZ